MTRNKYYKKVRSLLFAINQIPGNEKLRDFRPKTPAFGTQIQYGKYAGQILNSYAMSWDILKECLQDCKGLENVSW